jgi:hypothetical protein
MAAQPYLPVSRMVHDPALEAHESREHAEHAAHESDPFLSRVSITVAVLAVLAAAAGSLETVEGGAAITSSSESVLAQDKATDAWNEYQAESLKRHLYAIAAQEGGPHAAEFRQVADEQKDKQAGIRAQAMANEAERDRLVAESAVHERRHHWLTGAATLLEIGIAMSTITIITRRRPLWFGAMTLGAIGLLLLAIAYMS